MQERDASEQTAIGQERGVAERDTTEPAYTPPKNLLPPPEPAKAPPLEEKPAGQVIELSSEPEGIVADPETGLVAVGLRDPDKLALIDGDSGEVVRRVDLPGSARHLNLAAPGGPVLVPGEPSDSLIQVSLPDGEVVEKLGARAILATTAVGVVDPGIPLGRPILFDDLFFPENLLPNGTACTIFTEPGDPRRAHLIRDEPFAPRLRRKMELAAESLDLEATVGGVYAHTNGPRFETKSEIRWLNSVGVTAVSQTCGPEVVLTGELELPYVLVGFPVNYATGIAKPESEQELSHLLTLSAKTLTRLVLRTVELLEEKDLVYDHGFLYRVEGGLGGTENGLAPGAMSEESRVADASDLAGRRVAHYHPPGGQKS